MTPNKQEKEKMGTYACCWESKKTGERCAHSPSSMEERFDKEFTQYNLRDNKSEQKVARYIKNFILKELSLAISKERERVREKMVELIGYTSKIDKNYQTGFNTCREQVLSLLNKEQ